MALVAEHLVASVRGFDDSLLEPERASWLWDRLRGALPEAYSCELMPDHVHLMNPPGALRRFRNVLTGFTVRFGVRFDVLEPTEALSAEIAIRKMRYGLWNPVRGRLVPDPWLWQWSTLRDLAGAAYPLWTSLPDVARRLRKRPHVLMRELLNVADTPAAPLRTQPPATTDVSDLAHAVAAALRIPKADLRARPLPRRLLVQAWHAIGAPPSPTVAERLKLPLRTVQRHRSTQHPALDAVLRCVADPRLTASATIPRCPGSSWRR